MRLKIGRPTGFVGRDDELALLAGLLNAAGTFGPVAVSAVAGLAGVGKTTLAVQAEHPAMKHGLPWWVSASRRLYLWPLPAAVL